MSAQLKGCCRCKQSHPSEMFWANRTKRDGLQDYCKACAKKRRQENPEQARSRDRARYAANPLKRQASPEKKRGYNLMRYWGMTVDEFNARLEAQSGVCAICDLPPAKGRLQVDHDHETGKIRALLCAPCNKGIGCLKDSRRVLLSAARYLELHKEVMQ